MGVTPRLEAGGWIFHVFPQAEWRVDLREMEGKGQVGRLLCGFQTGDDEILMRVGWSRRVCGRHGQGLLTECEV